MQIVMDLPYQKTDKGRAEMSGGARSGMTPRSRSLLILVDGRTRLGELVARLAPGVDWRGIASELSSLGLIEPAASTPSSSSASASVQKPAVAAPARATTQASAPPASAPVATKPAVASAVEDPQKLVHARARVVQMLVPVFGPDAPRFAEPLLAAKSASAFKAALVEREKVLSVHAGKARAREVVQALHKLLD